MFSSGERWGLSHVRRSSQNDRSWPVLLILFCVALIMLAAKYHRTQSKEKTCVITVVSLLFNKA